MADSIVYWLTHHASFRLFLASTSILLAFGVYMGWKRLKMRRRTYRLGER